MNKLVSLIGVAICLSACSSWPIRKPPQQIFDPRFPYREYNLQVISDNMQNDVAIAGDMAGKVARKPQIAFDSFVKGYKGVTDRNPYERHEPYFYEEYSREALGKLGDELMEPLPANEMPLPSPLRSAFIVEGDPIDLTKEAIQYKNLLDQVDKLVAEAEKLTEEKQYLQALVKINQALDLDPANEAARTLYGKVIRAEERGYFELELEKKKAEVQEEKQKKEDERMMAEKRKKALMIEEFAKKIEKSLEMKDYDEASRLAAAAEQIDPENPRAKSLAEDVDLAIFKRSLDPRIVMNQTLLEDLILEHLKRFQEYHDTGLEHLARRELQKISFLESLKT